MTQIQAYLLAFVALIALFFLLLWLSGWRMPKKKSKPVNLQWTHYADYSSAFVGEKLFYIMKYKTWTINTNKPKSGSAWACYYSKIDGLNSLEAIGEFSAKLNAMNYCEAHYKRLPQ